MSVKSLAWVWRRRHIKRVVSLQKEILGNQLMTGLDIGAAEGLQPHWWSYEGTVEMYLIEPHDAAARRLEQIVSASPYRSMFHILPMAVGKHAAERVFYELNEATGSSLYPIDASSEFAGKDNKYIYPIRTYTVAVRRLADVLDEYEVARVDIAKLDVQGAELEVLSGLGDKRGNELLLVEVEVNIVGSINRPLSPYTGVPSWSELDTFLTDRGMRLLDVSVSRGYRSKDGDSDWYQREAFHVYVNSPGISAMAWEVDAVYVRDYRLLIGDGDEEGIRRLVVALGGYRFFSEAYFIIEEAQKAKVFTIDSAASLMSAVVAWHKLVARRPWHGRGGMWRLLRTMLMRSGFSQLRRWKQYMWFEYPSG